MEIFYGDDRFTVKGYRIDHGIVLYIYGAKDNYLYKKVTVREKDKESVKNAKV